MSSSVLDDAGLAPAQPSAAGPSSGSSLFKARKRRGGGRPGQRQRAKPDSDEEKDSEDEDEDDDDKEDKEDKQDKQDGAVIKMKRPRLRGGLGAGSKKNYNAQQKVYSSSSEDSEDEKPKAQPGGVVFKASGVATNVRSDQNATATNEIDTDKSLDARAIEERAKANREEVQAKDGSVLDDKVYRGINSYAKFIEKKDSAAGSSAKMSTGPQRAPSNIRSTVRWDYEPNICKDYKETGFCGFGDSCKFMHDRSDYKFGWQLEKEMEDGTYGMEDEDDNKYLISDDDEDLPFKCFICKESFKIPVVTRCKHYFCEKCALAHFKKTQRCFSCGKNTGGVFNPAKEIIAKLEKIKAKGGGGSDSEDNEEGGATEEIDNETTEQEVVEISD